MKARTPAFGEVGGAPVCGTASAEEDIGLGVATIVESEAQPDTATATGDTENDWLCGWCHSRVASEKDRFPYEGKDEFTFRNPEGIRFEIITFSKTLGCRETGTPTLEHTWFPVLTLYAGSGRICLPGVPEFPSRAHRSPEVGWLASNTFPPGVTD
jgi:hypothetical protein